MTATDRHQQTLEAAVRRWQSGEIDTATLHRAAPAGTRIEIQPAAVLSWSYGAAMYTARVRR